MNNNTPTKPKVTWVTPDHFLDTDFNPDLFKGLLQHFDIHWIVMFPSKNARFSESDLDDIEKLPGLTIEFIYWTSRARSIKTLLFYEKVYRSIKASKPDLTYFNYVPTNPFILPLYWRINQEKTIVTAHDGNVKSSFKMPMLSAMVFKLAFNAAKYVNMFSPTQAALFSASFKDARIFIILLGLKDFGVSRLEKRTDSIVFFFFGSINSNKNVGLLIRAACNLYDKGVRGFKISINGFCNDWDKYASQIKYPELFELDIRMIKNSEIADLFAKNHYAVFPYNEMSQSGAIKVAFNYNSPLITSDLQGFTDEVKNGLNGYVFKSEDVNDLERVITERITHHDSEYALMRDQIKRYNQVNYSIEALTGKYRQMFQNVISANK
ncbi:glycosyltransferase [Mucilaginibacter glaciei]|uniref:Glycosyltransferase n=1 Tax=Mucilaginibacter glaciei TaxID=2772109 RepID=A0A926S7F3_9SPHI|nr:glycosyltransferase [Mucilaginibacter glaciei]MBD1394646.1 glycosyltransferase [Mucilaginibacter glaciei]